VAYEVRQPELAVLANGAALTGVISVDVSANAYLCANRFTVHVAISGIPPDLWSDTPLLIEIRAGLGGTWQSLITGNADSVAFDPIQRVATLEGRDLTALLVTAQTAETFENRTASDIATLLATRHGLTPNVAPTTAFIGRYYQSGRTSTALSQHSSSTSEWDVLTSLAQQQGFDVWIDGHTLFFQPISENTVAASISPANCSAMQLHRRLDLASGPTVVVRSWDSQQGVATVGMAVSGSGTGPTFTALRPNLASGDATQIAQKTLAQLTAHASEVECRMPGDLVLLPRMTVDLSQTGTDFDGLYAVVETERSISFSGGFTQTVVLRGLPWTAS
jgi:prophage tail gpP-like protein